MQSNKQLYSLQCKHFNFQSSKIDENLAFTKFKGIFQEDAELICYFTFEIISTLTSTKFWT